MKNGKMAIAIAIDSKGKSSKEARFYEQNINEIGTKKKIPFDNLERWGKLLINQFEISRVWNLNILKRIFYMNKIWKGLKLVLVIKF